MIKETKKIETATFAGGCFWCLQADFGKVPGVIRVVSGYTGGTLTNPTYPNYAVGGHLEAVQIQFDPARASYERLLDLFWRRIDPTDGGGQFVDRGTHYRSAIFYHDEEQKRAAESSKAELEETGLFEKPIVTEILRFEKFYEAEDYHQGYHRKNPQGYGQYRQGSGRDEFLKKVWGSGGDTTRRNRKKTYRKPDETDLIRRLSPLQYEVTQKNGTEIPHQNEYWDNWREGIYVDVCSGEPLFSSRDKFDSGTGWPSFSRPLEAGNLLEREDRSNYMKRTEVRSKHGESHLGHVFADGPQPTGLRYCVNSAALRFIPREDLEREGYGEYLKLFQPKK